MLTVKEIENLQVKIDVANEELKQINSEIRYTEFRMNNLVSKLETDDSLKENHDADELIAHLDIMKELDVAQTYLMSLLKEKLSLIEEIKEKQDILDKYFEDTLPARINFVTKIVEKVAKSPKINKMIRQNAAYCIDNYRDDNTIGYFNSARREVYICVNNIAKDVLAMDHEDMVKVAKKVANCFYHEYRHVAQFKMILKYCKSYEKAEDYISKSNDYDYSNDPLEIDAFKYAEFQMACGNDRHGAYSSEGESKLGMLDAVGEIIFG